MNESNRNDCVLDRSLRLLIEAEGKPNVWWSALYVTLRESLEDQTVVAACKPLQTFTIENKSSFSWFFVRYWNGCPELRIRLSVDSRSQSIKAKKVLEQAVRSMDIGGASVIKKAYVRYRPEVRRYGGIDSIRAMEAWFMLSSDVVLSYLPVLEESLGRKITVLVFLAEIAVNTWISMDEDKKAYFERLVRSQIAFYCHGNNSKAAEWEQQCADAWKMNRVELNATVRGLVAASVIEEIQDIELKKWKVGLAKWKRAYAELLKNKYGPAAQIREQHSIRSVLPSMIHMTANRLGLSNLHETMAIYMLWRIWNMDDDPLDPLR